MKSRLPWVVVAASLAFNVLFMVGFLRARKDVAKEPRTSRDRFKRIADKLDLDERQWQAVEQFLDKKEQLRKDRAPQRDALLAEIVKENPDTKALEEFVLGKAAGDYRLARLALMQEFIAVLRPQQRERYVELIRKRRSASK